MIKLIQLCKLLEFMGAKPGPITIPELIRNPVSCHHHFTFSMTSLDACVTNLSTLKKLEKQPVVTQQSFPQNSKRSIAKNCHALAGTGCRIIGSFFMFFLAGTCCRHGPGICIAQSFCTQRASKRLPLLIADMLAFLDSLGVIFFLALLSVGKERSSLKMILFCKVSWSLKRKQS